MKYHSSTDGFQLKMFVEIGKTTGARVPMEVVRGEQGALGLEMAAFVSTKCLRHVSMLTCTYIVTGTCEDLGYSNRGTSIEYGSQQGISESLVLLQTAKLLLSILPASANVLHLKSSRYISLSPVRRRLRKGD